MCHEFYMLMCILCDYILRINYFSTVQVGLFSGNSIKHAVGVELNKEFADLSQSLIKKYALSSKVSIVCDDILNCSNLILQGLSSVW